MDGGGGERFNAFEALEDVCFMSLTSLSSSSSPAPSSYSSVSHHFPLLSIDLLQLTGRQVGHVQLNKAHYGAPYENFFLLLLLNLCTGGPVR